MESYAPIFLLYSIYDGTDDRQKVVELLEHHVDHFVEIHKRTVLGGQEG